MAKLQIRMALDEYKDSFVQLGQYVDDSGESFVQQSDRDSTDINLIVERFVKTGLLEGNAGLPKFGDFSEIVDYSEALQIVKAADESFMQLPAKIRAQFDNDPATFVDFVSDPANEVEMYKMGLYKDGYVPAQVLALNEKNAAEATLQESEQLPT